MSKANVSLSAEELGLVSTTHWIELKQGIMDKVGTIFSGASGDINNVFMESGIQDKYSLPLTTPKISKGEQYRGFPYMVLDYPRIFEGRDVFSLRTFFWWGHFFSVSIHLSGRYKSVFLTGKTGSAFHLPQDIFFCVHESPWHQYFGEGNFIPADKMQIREIFSVMENREFIRFAQKIELTQWNDLPDLLKIAYGRIINLLA